MKRIITLFFAAMLMMGFAAQAQNPVHWKASYKMGSNGTGTVTLTATIDKGWHVYGTDIPDVGPVPTSIQYSGEGFKFLGEAKAAPAAVKVQDEMFGCELAYWENKVTFTRKFKRVSKTAKTIKLDVTYMCCNDSNCLPPQTQTITVHIK